jgi:MFS family permease
LLAGALTALLIPLTEGRVLGWPWWSWLLLAACPLLAAGFVAVEWRVERSGRLPLLPSAVVSLQSIRRGLLLICPFFAGFAAFMFVYALTSQGPLHYGPLTAGLTIAPLAVTFLMASLYMPRALARWGRRVVVAGSLIQAAGIVGLAATLVATWPHPQPLMLAPAFCVIGFGQGLVMPSLMRITLSEVAPAVAGAGSGVLTTSQQVSLAFGVATLGTLFLTLSSGSKLGFEAAAVLILAVQTAIALVVAVGARVLPST